ncbi:uncharacterized protein BP01DRAFT_354315 [Aspergillus saccharolyticus JOP 1030-1]|uniref:Uncharacterized protein n=1 Tax=Aspergillus saccharolyticus JOP 1030-1 TaxID=1450539 RepID=A0A318ZUV0_9EURO|nr:hypothetical protein BP01DRAFT_354315 [Aspergillus saccharolyticus JOP 1030-1]PYH47780.1 hypothetical protein BP01DRAFT_354315 [Aspergillus saccharolyticus JOP 1030-1]
MTFVTPRPTLDRLGNGGSTDMRKEKCYCLLFIQSIMVSPMFISIYVISQPLWRFGSILSTQITLGYRSR